jgi:hypothetical protein
MGANVQAYPAKGRMQLALVVAPKYAHPTRLLIVVQQEHASKQRKIVNLLRLLRMYHIVFNPKKHPALVMTSVAQAIANRIAVALYQLMGIVCHLASLAIVLHPLIAKLVKHAPLLQHIPAQLQLGISCSPHMVLLL